MAFACPVCGNSLDEATGAAVCHACPQSFVKLAGVWRMLPPGRMASVQRFLADYTRVRLAEGRGSLDPAFYRNLPNCPDNHPLAWQWSIRRQTFCWFRSGVLTLIGARSRVLDIGAGTGWLSNRLARLGYLPCAVDLSCDERDGLGAARYFDSTWPCVQAEFDHLPFENASFDAVVFNASLHYSTDYARTLREALRVLAPAGTLAILETPVYRCESSGRRMAEERHELFQKLYGTRSDSVASLEFLTWDRIAALGKQLDLRWQVRRPWYGIRWALRPWIARLNNKREPSQFPILIAASADKN
jgi:SAM-dependent methyltransferase